MSGLGCRFWLLQEYCCTNCLECTEWWQLWVTKSLYFVLMSCQKPFIMPRYRGFHVIYENVLEQSSAFHNRLLLFPYQKLEPKGNWRSFLSAVKSQSRKGWMKFWNMNALICESAVTEKRNRTTPSSKQVVAENLCLSWLIVNRITINSNTEATRKTELRMFSMKWSGKPRSARFMITFSAPSDRLVSRIFEFHYTFFIGSGWHYTEESEPPN